MYKNGFTLLEMIVVILIVSILFILTLPNVSLVIDSVENKGCDALTKVVDSAIVQYKLEYGQIPGDIRDLVSAGYLNENQLTCSNGKTIYLEDGHAVFGD